METENQTTSDSNSNVRFMYQFTNNGINYYTDSHGFCCTTDEYNYAGMDGNFVMDQRGEFGVKEFEFETEASDGFSGQFDANTKSNMATDGAFQSMEPIETEMASLVNNFNIDPNGLSSQFRVDTSSNMAMDVDFRSVIFGNEITRSPTTNLYHKPRLTGSTKKYPSYAELITKAIESSAEKRMTLAQIYDWMVANVVEFKDKRFTNSKSGWKNSIRYNLSSHERFKQDGKGYSSPWTVTEEVATEPKKRPTKSTIRPRAKNMVTSGKNVNPMMSDQPLFSVQSIDQRKITGHLFWQESQAAITLDQSLEYGNTNGDIMWYQNGGFGVEEFQTEPASDPFLSGLTGRIDLNPSSYLATDGDFQPMEPTETEMDALMDNSYLDLDGVTGHVRVDTSSNVASRFNEHPPMLQWEPNNEICTFPTTSSTSKALNLHYAELITKAINSSPEKRMTSADIYDWMVANVAELKGQRSATSKTAWKKSIRNTLWENNRFKRVKGNNMAKPFFWTLTDPVYGYRIRVQTKSTTSDHSNNGAYSNSGQC